MKSFINIATVCLGLAISFTAHGQDGFKVNQEDSALLSQFGLDSIQPIQKSTAAKVRGEGGVARTNGFSFVSGILVDPSTTSNIFGLDANSAFSLLTLEDPLRPADPVHQHQSQLELELSVDTYFSNIIGGAGGAAAAYFR